MEILALVDNDGVVLVLGPKPFAGLHQGLGRDLRPERLVPGVAHLLQAQACRLAQVVRKTVIGVDDEAVAEGLRHRLLQPVLERPVVAKEQRAQARTDE